MTALRSRRSDLRLHSGVALALSVLLLAVVSGAGGATRPGTITMQGVGEITVGHRYDLAFQAPGRIQTVAAQVGAHVHAGDVLAALDQTQARGQLASARATLLAARAELSSLRRGGAQAAADRAILLRDRRAVGTAQARLDSALATVKAQLASASSTSAHASSELTRAIRAVSDGTKALVQARMDLATSTNDLGAAKRALAADRALIASAQAKMAQDEKLQAAGEGEQAKHEAALQDAETDYQVALANADGAAASSARRRADAERSAISSSRDRLTELAQALIDDQADVSSQQVAAQQDADTAGDVAVTVTAARASAERLGQGLADAKTHLLDSRDTLANARHAEAVQQALGRAARADAEGAVSDARASAEVTRRTERAESSSAVGKADSDLAAAKAGVDLAVAALRATVLRAPADGIVAAVNVAPGDTAGASGSLVAALTMITDVAHVTAAFDEVDAAKIRVGQPAAVSIRALDATSLPASVIRIGLLPSADPASGDRAAASTGTGDSPTAGATSQPSAPDTTSGTGSSRATFHVELVLRAGNPLLRPGMTATVELEAPAPSG